MWPGARVPIYNIHTYACTYEWMIMYTSEISMGFHVYVAASAFWNSKSSDKRNNKF